MGITFSCAEHEQKSRREEIYVQIKHVHVVSVFCVP